jgi:glycosyltransferase involved in cell wall biosynthesis
VALAAHNAAGTIARAVDSLLSQTHADVSVYVVDDASTDDTAARARAANADPRLHVLRLSANIGTYAVKNLVLRFFASGPFFAHQDADDASHPTRFARQMAFLKEHPEIAACGTGIDEFCADETIVHVPSPHPWQLGGDGYLHRSNFYDLRVARGACFRHDLREPGSLKIAMNGSLMFRTEALLAIGGFDAASRAGGDTEALWRLLLFHDIGNVPDVLYSRLFHRQSLTQSPSYGLTSAARRAYIRTIEERLAGWRGLYERDAWEVLRRRTAYALDVPDVSWDALCAHEQCCRPVERVSGA